MRARKFLAGLVRVLVCLGIFPWLLAVTILYFAAGAGAIVLSLLDELERYLRGRLLRNGP